MLFILLTSWSPGSFYPDVSTSTLFSRDIYGIWIIQKQKNLVEGIYYFGSFLCIYLSWYLFIWISIWGFLFSVFLVLLFYFASWFLFMYFYDIHLSRDLGSKYIFKRKRKKSWAVISILPKNLFHGNTLRILIVTECGNNLYMAP